MGDLLNISKIRLEKNHNKTMKELGDIIRLLLSFNAELNKYKKYLIIQRLQRTVRNYLEKFYSIRNVEVENYRQSIIKEDENVNNKKIHSE